MMNKTNTGNKRGRQQLGLLCLLPLIFGATACTETSEIDSDLPWTSESVGMAVIGDSPYQPDEIAKFPQLVSLINADSRVSTTIHVGDIKAGGTRCTDEQYTEVHRMFNTFEEPLVYTIGDNEWADCDRPSAGEYNSEERLDKLREIFFSVPGTSLGIRKKQVEAQVGYPENQYWQEKGIVFGTLHVVGSNNNLETNAQLLGPVEQTTTGSTEYGRRTAANLTWMRDIFSRATDSQAAGIALFFHADMWKLQSDNSDFDETVFNETDFGGFRQIVQELSVLAEAFSKPVIIVNGDHHHFRADTEVDWFSHYDISPVSNLTQIVVERGIEPYSNGTRLRLHWLKLVADASTEEVFNWKLITRN